MVRVIRRVAVVGITAAFVTVAAVGPAVASPEDVAPGGGISLGLLLLIFVGVPLGLFLVLAALIYGPDVAGRPRYRPGVREWEHAPVWIGGPDEPDAALSRTTEGSTRDVRGGGAGAGW